MIPKTALADIAFECPFCRGPLLAEAAWAGLSFECPHCFEQTQIPAGEAVNKDKFMEPHGLRRVLKQVRDREWELLRRKLRTSHARVTELESKLQDVPEKGGEQRQVDAAAELDSLRKQLADQSEKLAQASQAASAARKQQDIALENLRRDVDTAREDAQTQRKLNDELTTALHEASAAKAQAPAPGEVEALRTQLADAQQALAEVRSRLEAEQAKVFLMEAAAGGTLQAAQAAGATPSATVANTGRQEDGIAELQAQIAELRKNNTSLRGSRDRARDELAEFKKRAVLPPVVPEEVATALDGLEASLQDVLRLIAAQKKQQG